MNRLLIVSVLLAASSLEGSALAWDSASLWYDPAAGALAQPYDLAPGGGGVLATGGQGDYSITCANCHMKGATQFGTIGLTITPPIPAMYKPGTTYDFTVKLTGEHLGNEGKCSPYVLGNLNEFAITFEDATGKLAGAFTTEYGTSVNCPQTPPDDKVFMGSTYMYKDCRAVIANPKPDRTSWTFSWTAPSKGAGAVTAFWGAVDGDCMMDSKMDDVVVGNATMSEGMALNTPAPPPPDSDPNAPPPWSLAFLPFMGAAIAWRRKRS